MPDLHRDQMRWAWRRFCCDRDKPAAWAAKARAILLDLRQRGPVPAELEHATGDERHVLFVERRATAYEWRSRISDAEIERALRAPQTVRRDAATKASPRSCLVPESAAGTAEFDHAAFLAMHWRDVFYPVFKRLRLDPDADDAAARRLALAYHDVLDGGEAAAWQRWCRLLRELDAG